MDNGHNKGIEVNMDASALAFISKITKDIVSQVQMK